MDNVSSLAQIRSNKDQVPNPNPKLQIPTGNHKRDLGVQAYLRGVAAARPRAPSLARAPPSGNGTTRTTPAHSLQTLDRVRRRWSGLRIQEIFFFFLTPGEAIDEWNCGRKVVFVFFWAWRCCDICSLDFSGPLLLNASLAHYCSLAVLVRLNSEL